MVRSGCTVITRVNTKKLGPMMLDTALIPAAVITMAASTNRPDEAVASADAAVAGLGALVAAVPDRVVQQPWRLSLEIGASLEGVSSPGTSIWSLTQLAVGC